MTDFKEAKRLIAYAKRAGVRSLTWGDLQVEFHAPGAQPPRQRGAIEASAPKAAGNDTPKPAPAEAPTLEQINEFIYGKNGDPDAPFEQH